MLALLSRIIRQITKHVTEIIFGTVITGLLIVFVRPLRRFAVKLLDNAMTGSIDEHMGTMSNIFEGAGIQAATGIQSPDGPSQTGLMIGVADMNAPPPAAKKIKELFAKYGISINILFAQREQSEHRRI